MEDLLKLVKNLTRKIKTIEDAVALDASVLGEQIEARELDMIMKVRAGGAQADQVYREGERNQGIDEGLEILNRYLDLMKAFATEDVEQIPNGIYSVKQGPQSGVYVMLKMPEHLSGEVFWRFYPNGNVAQPITSPNDVLGIIEAHPEELRVEFPPNENPFKHLQKPLEAAVSQVGEAYLQAVSSIMPGKFTARVRRILQRDDLLKADPELWQWFNEWTQQSLPSDALKRRAMLDPVRVVNRLNLRSAKLPDLSTVLRGLKGAIEEEGLDRPLQRPDSAQPSVRDLELVAWELVVGPDEPQHPDGEGA